MINNSNQNSFFKIVFVCFLLLLSSCQNTNTSGVGLVLRDPKPPAPTDLQQQGEQVITTYKSTLALPEDGFTKLTEYGDSLRLTNGFECRYTILETATLKNRETLVLTEYKYKQIPNPENRELCPVKLDKYVGHTKSPTFEEYANQKVAIFLSYSNVESVLQANPKMRSAQVLVMQSTKMHNMDALFVRMKLTDMFNEQYLLETTFSTMNSFIDVMEQKFSSLKTNEQISYRKLIVD